MDAAANTKKVKSDKLNFIHTLLIKEFDAGTFSDKSLQERPWSKDDQDHVHHARYKVLERDYVAWLCEECRAFPLRHKVRNKNWKPISLAVSPSEKLVYSISNTHVYRSVHLF